MLPTDPPFLVGCAEVPDDVYDVDYPELTYQTDLAVTPVYTDSTKVRTVRVKILVFMSTTSGT